MLVMDSSLLELLGPGEQRAVIGHELGHILSDHVLYMTALGHPRARRLGTLPVIVGVPLRAVRAVLLEWMRAAELSSDRAATLAVRDPQIMCRALMVLAAGLPADRLDLDAFMAQAMEYEAGMTPRIGCGGLEIGATHASSVRRVSEVLSWSSGEHGLQAKEFTLDDEALQMVIRRYTREAGVRNLEREMATLARKSVKDLILSKKKSVKISIKNIEQFLGVPLSLWRGGAGGSGRHGDRSRLDRGRRRVPHGRGRHDARQGQDDRQRQPPRRDEGVHRRRRPTSAAGLSTSASSRRCSTARTSTSTFRKERRRRTVRRRVSPWSRRSSRS